MGSRLPERWVTPENPWLARRQKIWGMPREYAALLLVVVLQTGLVLHLWVAAIAIAVLGHQVGKLIDAIDPWAGELFMRSLRLPRMLRA